MLKIMTERVNLFVIITACFLLKVWSSKSCRNSTGVVQHSYHMDGQYFWTVTTDLEPEKDCSGFRGRYVTDEIVNLVVTDSPYISEHRVFQVRVKDNRVTVMYSEYDCWALPWSNKHFYMIYIDFCQWTCFYVCGHGDDLDSVNCFSRAQTIDDYDMAELRTFLSNTTYTPVPIDYDKPNFRRIDRSLCLI